MHKLNVLILGPNSFFSTLNELKPFLKFNPTEEKNSSDFDAILFHEESLNYKKDNKFISTSHSLKICASSKKILSNNFDAFLEIPSTLREINAVVENISAKKEFNKN